MLYDYTRFAGLQVLLQSIISGSVLIEPIFEYSLEKKIKNFIDHNCTHLSATPTLWRKILMTPDSDQINLLQATLGGEIADDKILSAVSKHFPNARIAHIFASTEAGVGFSVIDKKRIGKLTTLMSKNIEDAFKWSPTKEDNVRELTEENFIQRLEELNLVGGD